MCYTSFDVCYGLVRYVSVLFVVRYLMCVMVLYGTVCECTVSAKLKIVIITPLH